MALPKMREDVDKGLSGKYSENNKGFHSGSQRQDQQPSRQASGRP